MRITIVAVGKKKTTYHDAALAEYEKRLSRWTKITWQLIPSGTIDTESAHLLQSLTPLSHIILLDERGQQWSTLELSEQLEKVQNSSAKSLIFIIGGAHGVNQTVRDRVDHIWSLSQLIFPHEMVRLILVEQLYRAYDILNNGSYHHA